MFGYSIHYASFDTFEKKGRLFTPQSKINYWVIYRSVNFQERDFFQGFEISRSFLRAKQVGKKGGNFQNPE